MKAIHIFVAWLISVILGSFIVGMFFQEMELILICLMLSGLISIPYLVIMSLIARKMDNFWLIQSIHLGLSLATAVVMGAIVSEFLPCFAIISVYFVIGVVTQSIIYFSVPHPESTEPASPELLDQQS